MLRVGLMQEPRRCGVPPVGMLAGGGRRLCVARSHPCPLQQSSRCYPRLGLQVRVVKQQPTETLAALLNALFSPADTSETVRSLYVGVSGHQKLELLAHLLRLLGFESLAVFGDCFDEVGWGARPLCLFPLSCLCCAPALPAERCVEAAATTPGRLLFFCCLPLLDAFWALFQAA